MALAQFKEWQVTSFLHFGPIHFWTPWHSCTEMSCHVTEFFSVYHHSYRLVTLICVVAQLSTAIGLKVTFLIHSNRVQQSRKLKLIPRSWFFYILKCAVMWNGVYMSENTFTIFLKSQTLDSRMSKFSKIGKDIFNTHILKTAITYLTISQQLDEI